MTSPLIGVTPSARLNRLGIREYTLAADYTTAIERAGGLPVLLPLHVSDIPALLDRLDGVVFSGGGDIDPARFNQEQHETVDGVDEERDEFEISLMNEAFARDMPILAICRGAQVMNVERGGTLIQDIAAQTDSEAQHNQRAEGSGEHDIFQTATMTAAKNPVSAALGNDVVNINSFHHQALGEVPESLEVVATSDDGIIEAVYAPAQTYAIGVQWHPERLAREHAEHQALFDQLIESARAFAAKK